MSGPIRVDRPAQIKGGKEVGYWDAKRRRIVIEATLPREYAWQVLLHELVHASETDSGYYLPEPRSASVHDAIASGMMHVVRLLLAG